MPALFEHRNGYFNRTTRRWLVGALSAIVLVPAIFYLQFGVVGPVGWGLTVFLVVLCLLVAIGLHFRRRSKYHSPVELKGDWLDRVGAFWLLTCAFGPFLGWVLTAGVPLTVGNWRWLYAARVLLSIVLPVITALPLVRYVRGRGAPLMLGLLLGVTALPVWSGLASLRDLRAGPVDLILPHTRKVLSDR
jgi:hypothetical protein